MPHHRKVGITTTNNCQTGQSCTSSLFTQIPTYVMLIFLFVTLTGFTPQQKPGNWQNLKLVNDQPTNQSDFGSAYPIGNGRLGAKIFGTPEKEIIPLNEVTLWSGEPRHYEDPKTPALIQEMRKAIAARDFKKADDLGRQHSGKNNQSYQPLGDLTLQFPDATTYTGYSRELDMDRALITVRYTANGIRYTRESFISYPDNVIVMRIYSDRKGSVNFSAGLSTLLQGKTRIEGQNGIAMTGRAPYQVDGYTQKKIVLWDPARGIGFDCRLQIKNTGGSLRQNGTGWMVQGADTAVIILTAATSFNGFDKNPATEGKDPGAIVKDIMAKATVKSYQKLFDAHIRDYQSIFRRLWVEVNNETSNPNVQAYQWARYNLIACSRPGGGAPRNEQGIWNRDTVPRYASNYTLNENPQKYYTIAEAANIAEVTEPLLGFIGNLAKNGETTARVDYGFRGWVAHHNSDVWAMTTMATGDPCWAFWPVGGIWLTEHLWEHYAFGMDKTYLRDQAYPIMKGAALFALDLMVKNENGYLVTSPSTSPENHFYDAAGNRVAVSAGTTLDMALIKELFQNCIKASTVLQTDVAFRKELEATLPKLLPFQIGKSGELLEFSEDWSDGFKVWEPNHRHISHVISLWPLSQINRNTPQLMAAAKKSLEMRGSGGYHPDKAGMWARMFEGDLCLAALGTSFPSMYDSPPGGFAEMLLQSQTGELELLPALPQKWASGKILGIRARGGYEVDMEWANNELTKAVIRSFAGNTPTIRVQGILVNPASDRRIQILPTPIMIHIKMYF